MLKKFTILILLVLIKETLFATTPFTVEKIEIISLNDQYLIAGKWSPDGKYIAAAGKNYGSIWLYHVASAEWQKLIEENGAGWDFDWSPDSRKIAFRANKFIKRRKQTTIKYVDIMTGKTEKTADYGRDFSTPKWLTADVLTFMHKEKLKTVSISETALMKPDSSFQQKNVPLFSNKGYYIGKSNRELQLLEPLKGQTFNVSFSPDGNTILFEKSDGKIYTCRENGDEVKVVAEGEMPAWSPDGNFIVFATPKDDGYKIISSDIFICDANGKNKQQITKTEDELELRPHWSPDGKNIIYDSEGKIHLITLKME